MCDAIRSNQGTKTRRSIGPEIGIDDAERSIPTPISLSDSNDGNEDMDEDGDGDVLMGSPDADAGTEENPIELTDDDDVPAATGKESGGKENGKGKMSPRRVWGLHVQQLTELWGDDDDEGVIQGELVYSFLCYASFRMSTQHATQLSSLCGASRIPS